MSLTPRIIATHEVFDSNGRGAAVFRWTNVVLTVSSREGTSYWLTQYYGRESKLSPSEEQGLLRSCCSRINWADLRLPVHCDQLNHLIAPNPRSSTSYIKGVEYYMDIIAVMDLQAGPPAVGYYMALELDSLWHVTRRSHPNICEYLGCVLDGQHITGLCFKRYKCTLHDAIEHRMPLDFYSVTSGIASGVQHLHSMGLVHGNLKPTNIMLDDDDTPIIIDFDQCQKSGATLSYKRGTPGWCPDPLPSIARFETDLYAMDRIFQYLQERTAPFHAGTAENTPSTMTIKLSFR